ncbi:putative ABC transporter permease protein YurN [Paenibacillus sp. J31TS4]|uniref:carbohydrate ABC transporter permease n=1 Tax=Paenibacillus sp. J31TS4 TaxID=2807195 RepID=UPI001B2E3937|nr:sugar ABC transporter permease [Paenibacillus sp. J31TS4]GIP39819.1 putative ABC transporter permease protein YurN [Paenibacillus sp. J31TS4]
MKSGERSFIWVCTLPALLLAAVFVFYPFAQALLMSFYSWSGISDEKVFIGLDNFRTMLGDEIVWKALKNNLFLLLTVPVLTMGLAVLFSVLLTRKKLKERNFYRTVFFFPNVLALVVISILWSFIYHPTFGIVNSLLNAVGLEQWTHAWLGEQGTVMWALVFPMVWQAVGYYMIIYIAAIEGIPTDLYEVAHLEGASEWQQFRLITLPLIWTVMRVTLILFLINVFNQSFTYVNVMTAGGPDNGSQILMTYMYGQGFANGNFGYAMAIGVLMLGITIALSLLSELLTKRETIQY